jgi:AcrR family transcriptional regulator
MKKENDNSDYIFSKAVPPKPRKSDELRRRIVETFITLVSTTGLERTSVDEIAKRLEMRRNHVGYYFPSRADLIHAAVQYAFSVGQQMTAKKLSKANDWKQIVEAWCLGAFDWIDEYPEHGAVILLFYSQCYHDVRYREFNTQILRNGVERAASHLRAAYPNLALHKLEEHLRSIQTFNWGLIMGFLTRSDIRSMKQLKERSKFNAWKVLLPLFPPKKAGRSM